MAHMPLMGLWDAVMAAPLWPHGWNADEVQLKEGMVFHEIGGQVKMYSPFLIQFYLLVLSDVSCYCTGLFLVPLSSDYL
jgi:hypothetical protein